MRNRIRMSTIGSFGIIRRTNAWHPTQRTESDAMLYVHKDTGDRDSRRLPCDHIHATGIDISHIDAVISSIESPIIS
jgi:hypothetical protein